ncbi:hypothetical protein ACLIIZ_12915 [Azonexus caeni]|uniref:hypothetical protein n=1 Tax=Azonexus caeni TaxID=266126 RepID=UPI003A8C1722
MLAERKTVLILCKTYPSPSASYVETSCVAGMEHTGKLIRLFPVPFRLVSDEQQFRKWQWITARVRKTREDNRPESHRISVDTIELLGEPLSPRNEWGERRQAIAPLQIFTSFAALDAARETRGISLGLLRPQRLIDLLITSADTPEWTPEEKAKLMQAQTQGSLFDQHDEQKSLKLLKKLPFDFHYVYACESDGIVTTHKHKLVDWEAGALFWNVHRKQDWQKLFRQKYLVEFSTKDLLFLMGTIHRFPKQWLIVGVIYPPKPLAAQAGQGELF